MRSPFPGMDPFLEPHWTDVHLGILAEAHKELNQTLPDGLVARLQMRDVADANGQPANRISSTITIEHNPNWRDVACESADEISAPFRILLDY